MVRPLSDWEGRYIFYSRSCSFNEILSFSLVGRTNFLPADNRSHNWDDPPVAWQRNAIGFVYLAAHSIAMYNRDWADSFQAIPAT